MGGRERVGKRENDNTVIGEREIERECVCLCVSVSVCVCEREREDTCIDIS